MAETSTTGRAGYRILVVEDEPDWQSSMSRLLGYVCRERALPEPSIDRAFDAAEGRRLLTAHHYHLVSLDMRLPAAMNDTIDVVEGIQLAEAALSPIASLPKTILYTATLSQEPTVYEESMQVLDRLPGVDKYAKAAGDNQPKRQVFEFLDQRQWAERVLDYLYCEDRELPTLGPGGRRYLSALGAWLTGAVVALPPILARQAQELQNAWPRAGGKVNALVLDAGLKFIEATLRLALAQTAVLCASSKPGVRCAPPDDDTLRAPVDLLRQWMGSESGIPAGSSWRRHLTAEALAAFDSARRLRNDMRHNLRTSAASAFWSELLPLLRRVMDVAAYWAKHPLCVDLHFGRDGWSGELLAGTAWPRPYRKLPGADFPGEAASSGCWQIAVIAQVEAPGWREMAVSWQGWLARDPGSERSYWLKSHQGRGGQMAIDIDSGELGVIPGERSPRRY